MTCRVAPSEQQGATKKKMDGKADFQPCWPHLTLPLVSLRGLDVESVHCITKRMSFYIASRSAMQTDNGLKLEVD